jgi:hypothetical protein
LHLIFRMFSWLDHNAAAVQALASIATVFIMLALAWITRKYVLLTQDLAVAAREQLRFQQHSERSDAAQLLTLVEMCLGNLAHMPADDQDIERVRDVSIWRHSDVSTFASLAAAVLGSSPPVHDAIQGLNAIRAKVDALRQLPADQTVGHTFSWIEWRRELVRTRTALRAVRTAAEAAELSLTERCEIDSPADAVAPGKLSIVPKPKDHPIPSALTHE